ncbi:MAG: class I SAM-dependent methyltransferase [Mycobacteriales bacterium]|nr:class I SAM-dependent methyltransferase [Frankia sp.]
MDNSWAWDPTLFAGTAKYYVKGRITYAPQTAERLAAVLELNGSGRLLDVGTGPGDVALALAPYFDEVIGVDPDPEMLAQARSRARALGANNVQWLELRSEDLSPDLGSFRVAAFGQSFHWMDRELVAGVVYELLEPGGYFVHLNAQDGDAPADVEPGGRRVPFDDIAALVRRYLGPVRRAGQGRLPQGTPDDEAAVLAAAGFAGETEIALPGGELMQRSVDDVVAWVFSRSGSAPHLFGDGVDQFERELRQLLSATSLDGMFVDPRPDTIVRVWQKPGGQSITS